MQIVKRSLLLAVLSITFLTATQPYASGSFARAFNFGGMKLKIEQTYTDDGVSKPVVHLNDATLRQYSHMQRLEIAYEALLVSNDISERVVVLYHWDGAVSCAGNFTIFSLSNEGFEHYPMFGNCVENYTIETKFEDDEEFLLITSFSDEEKTKIQKSWSYRNHVLFLP